MGIRRTHVQGRGAVGHDRPGCSWGMSSLIWLQIERVQGVERGGHKTKKVERWGVRKGPLAQMTML